MISSRLALAAAVLVAWIALPAIASAEGVGAECKAACEARNIPTSCR